MSTAALEPRSFLDTSSLLSRVAMSRATSLLLLLALALAVVAAGMMRGRLFPPPTPYVASMHYAADRLRAGELPLWNPHEHLGEPVARDGRAALWYPATILHVLLGQQGHAWHAIVVLHLWLAGCGAWMLAGRYGLEPVPRLMSGTAYMLCGTTVLGLDTTQANVLVWLPWAAFAVERLSDRMTPGRTLAAALVLTVQLLGGDLLASAALVVTAALALFVRVLWIGPRRLLAAALAFAVALAIAVAASAVQWVSVIWPWQANPLSALSAIPRAWPWGAGPFLLDATSPALFGTIPLLLAGIAVWYGHRPRAVVLWLTVGLVMTAVAVALEVWVRTGSAGAAAAAAALPRPRVFIAAASLAVALLAGFGVETVIALAAARAARVRAALMFVAGLFGGVAVVVAAYFVKVPGAQGPGELLLHVARLAVGAAMACAAALVVRSHELPQWRSRGWPWVALACAELLAFAAPTMRGVALKDLRDVSDVAAFLRARGASGRFIAAPGRVPEALATWQALEDAGGAGRGSWRHAAWCAAAAASGGRNGSHALRVAQVQYLVADRRYAPAPPPPWRAVHRNASLTIYEDPQPLPRAWLAAEARRVSSAAEALHALVAAPPAGTERVALIDEQHLDARDRTLIARRPGYWSHRGDAETVGDITYTVHHPEFVRVTVRGGGGGWLVIADAYALGWRAMVQNNAEPIVPAFGVLRAVAVPAGDVDVVLTYDPRWWGYAVALSCAGGVVMVGLLAWALLRSRREAGEMVWRVQDSFGNPGR